MGLSSIVKQTVLRLLCTMHGTASIEYAVIASLVSIVAIGSMLAIGGSVAGFFNSMQAAFR